jgi:hypothetical protein
MSAQEYYQQAPEAQGQGQDRQGPGGYPQQPQQSYGNYPPQNGNGYPQQQYQQYDNNNNGYQQGFPPNQSQPNHYAPPTSEPPPHQGNHYAPPTSAPPPPQPNYGMKPSQPYAPTQENAEFQPQHVPDQAPFSQADEKTGPRMAPKARLNDPIFLVLYIASVAGFAVLSGIAIKTFVDLNGLGGGVGNARQGGTGTAVTLN